MPGRSILVALAAAAIAMLDIAGTAFAASDRMPREPAEEYLSVQPCSLVGINPASHPEIFGNPATARNFGFVRAKDGTWQVMPNCRVK
jgi:hypothetical protein